MVERYKHGDPMPTLADTLAARPVRLIVGAVIFAFTLGGIGGVLTYQHAKHKTQEIQARYAGCMRVESAFIVKEMHDGGFNPEAVAHISKSEAAANCCRRMGRIAVEASGWVVVCLKSDISELVYRSPDWVEEQR